MSLMYPHKERQSLTIQCWCPYDVTLIQWANQIQIRDLLDNITTCTHFREGTSFPFPRNYTSFLQRLHYWIDACSLTINDSHQPDNVGVLMMQH